MLARCSVVEEARKEGYEAVRSEEEEEVS